MAQDPPTAQGANPPPLLLELLKGASSSGSSSPALAPVISEKQCQLIAGWIAMSAQLVLLLVVITALTVKR